MRFEIWFGLLGGATAWTIHLIASYFVVPLVCATGMEVILYAITLGTAVLALAATVVAFVVWRSTVADPRADARPPVYRSRFLGATGALLSGLFLLVILAQALPVLMHHPCDPLGGLGV